MPAVVAGHKRRARLQDVAREAGVSAVTVSRAFNDHPHVSTAMREHVQRAARKLGYRPLRMTRRKVLGLLVGDLSRVATAHTSTRLLLHVVQEAAQRGHLVQFIPHDALPLAMDNPVVGLLSAGLRGKECLALEDMPPVRCVSLDRPEIPPPCSYIGADYRVEGALAAGHLLAHGHRKLALVIDEAGPVAEARQRGCEDAMSGPWPGASLDILLAGERGAEGVALDLEQRGITGMLLLSEVYCMRILRELVHVRKRRIPKELSVIGLEHAPLCSAFSPPLTTIAQPLEAIAREAVNHVLDRKSARKPCHLALPGQMIERASVGPPPE